MAPQNPLGWIELAFSQDKKDYFSGILKQIVKEDYLYYSPVMPHIKGDVTAKLHCTLFFGLNPNLKDDPELNDIVNEANFPELKLGELFFIEGYQGLYRILCIKVLDDDHRLEDFSDQIDNFLQDDRARTREFKPHITLAYVKSDYQLPEKLPEFEKTLAVEKIQICV